MFLLVNMLKTINENLYQVLNTENDSNQNKIKLLTNSEEILNRINETFNNREKQIQATVNYSRVVELEKQEGTFLGVGNKKIGVLVSLEQENEELGKDLAMHIAASNPLAISPEEISEEIISKEKEIIEAQVSDADKPQEIIEKMTSGRLKKFLSEVSLIDQPFVKDPSLNVSDLLKNNHNSVLSFIRYEVGEGIEVEKKDFAEEVQAQLEN